MGKLVYWVSHAEWEQIRHPVAVVLDLHVLSVGCSSWLANMHIQNLLADL